MQLSVVLKEGAQMAPLLSDLLLFHVCWAPAHGPPAELVPPPLAKLTLAPRALLESQKVLLLLSAGLKFSPSFLGSWVET